MLNALFIRLFTFSLLFGLGISTLQANKLDSLLKLMPRTGKSERVALLNSIAYEYRFLVPDSTISIANQAYDLAIKQNNRYELARSLHYQGIGYRRKTDYAKANVFFEESLLLFSESEDKKGISDVQNSIGVTYYYLGAYETALEYFLAALATKNEVNDLEGIANICNNIGVLFELQKKLDDALAYHLRSLGIEKKLQNKQGVSTSYHNIGIIYMDKDQLRTSLAYFDSSMSISMVINDSRAIARTLVNIGEVYIKQGLFEAARSNYKRALNTYQQSDNKEGIASCYYGLGMVAYNERDYRSGLGFFFRSLELSRQGLYMKMIAENLHMIAESYLNVNDFQSAYRYQKEYHQLNDSVFSESTTKKLSEMQLQFELKKREREIELKDKEIQIRDLELNQSRIYTYSAVVVIILLGLLGLLLYLRSRFEQRVHRTLKVQNSEITKQKEEISRQRDEISKSHKKITEAQDIIFMQNERLKSVNNDLEKMVKKRTRELEESYKELLEVNAELDTFLYKASHDIKGPLSRMKGLAVLGQIEVKDETGKEYIRKLDEVVGQMDIILVRLLSYHKVKHHIAEQNPILIESLIEQVITEIETTEKAAFAQKKIDVKIEPTIYADDYLVREILYNLIENAHHYSKEKNKASLKIIVDRYGKQLQISVLDQGIGIPDSISKQVFDIFFRGTQRSQGSGLGLYISRMAAYKMGGQLLFSTDDKYTIFQLSIPDKTQ